MGGIREAGTLGVLRRELLFKMLEGLSFMGGESMIYEP